MAWQSSLSRCCAKVARTSVLRFSKVAFQMSTSGCMKSLFQILQWTRSGLLRKSKLHEMAGKALFAYCLWFQPRDRTGYAVHIPRTFAGWTKTPCELVPARLARLSTLPVWETSQFLFCSRFQPELSSPLVWWTFPSLQTKPLSRVFGDGLILFGPSN